MPVDAYTGRQIGNAEPDLFNRIRTPAHTNDPPAAKEAAAKQNVTKRAMAAAEAVRSLIDQWGEPPTACEVGLEMYGAEDDPLKCYKRTENARRALSDGKAAKPRALVKHAGYDRVGRVSREKATAWELA